MTTWIDLAGWTLVHFVWQGALVAAVTALALRLLRGATPHARYALACAALLGMLIVPAATAVMLARSLPARPMPAATLIAIDASVTDASVTPGASGADGTPQPATTAASSDRRVPLSVAPILPAIVIIWLSGVAILLARLAGGCWRVRRLHRVSFGEPPSRWHATAEGIARRLRLSGSVFVVDSDRVDTPTVIGWLRPVILLPVAAMASLTPAQVEAILAHELAHIRRHDFPVNLLQTIAETLLFYHPAVWWISARVRIEREHCCDDVAVDVCGDAVTYATALTELAAWSIARAPLAVTATSGTLLGRVRRLLNGPADGTPRSSSGILVAGLALALVLVVGSLRAISVAQTTDPGAANSEPRFGPMEINRLLGFDLFPEPVQWATDDPRDTKSWAVTINYASGELPLIGFSGRSLIRHAYGLVGTPIVNAPDWLDAETFDLVIAAALPDPTHPDAMHAPLRELFEQRLGLVARMDVREFPVYALVRANPDTTLGPNLKASSSTIECVGARDSNGPVVHNRSRGELVPFCGIDNNFFGITGRRVTMAEFSQGMRREMNPLAPDRPVIDRTRLTGTYDFTLRYGPVPLAAIGYTHPSIGAALSPFGIRTLFTALPEQLGLRLIESTAPFEVLVIDRITRPGA